MRDVNKIMLSGHVLAQPEVSAPRDQPPRATFQLTQSIDGVRQIFTVVAWQRRAEVVARLVKAGVHVLVEGRIQSHDGELEIGLAELFVLSPPEKQQAERRPYRETADLPL
jgi:single-stranded DNA-binding protein